MVRSAALADELRARGWECNFEPNRTGAPDLCIVDGHKRPDVYAIHASVPFVLISDGRTLDPLLVDDDDDKPPALIVNGGAGAHPYMYAESGAKRVLAGPAYALLRPEFSKTHWPTHTDDAFGLGFDWLDARRFVGMDAGQMARAMAGTQVLLTAGGMRAMEAACVGAPMVLFIESEDQESNAYALQKCAAGMIARDEAYGKKLVRELLKDPDWLARMSAAGRRLVDGKGCQRVADAIEELV